MIWRWQDNSRDWRKRFTLLPICLRDGPNRTLVWLQWVWKRDCGLFTDVSLTDPAALKDQSQ